MSGFKNRSLKENFERIQNPKIFLSEEEESVTEFQFVSNIDEAWSKPDNVRRDVRDFLLQLEYNEVQDFIIDDMINAIKNGVEEFNEMSNRI